MLPGTVGIYQGQGGYTDVAAYVTANQPLAPVDFDFDFDGGVLDIWLADSNYGTTWLASTAATRAGS